MQRKEKSLQRTNVLTTHWRPSHDSQKIGAGKADIMMMIVMLCRNNGDRPQDRFSRSRFPSKTGPNPDLLALTLNLNSSHVKTATCDVTETARPVA